MDASIFAKTPPSDVETAVADLALHHKLLEPAEAVELIVAARATSPASPQEADSQLLDRLLSRVRNKDLLAAVAEGQGVEFVDLFDSATMWKVEAELLARCDISTLERHSALPVRHRGDGRIGALMANPTVLEAKDYLNAVFGNAVPLLASRKQIHSQLAGASEGAELPDPEEEEDTAQPQTQREPASTAAPSPIVSFVENMLTKAAADGASDIHLAFSSRKTLDVRFRIDGVLRPYPARVSGAQGRQIVAALMSRTNSMDTANIRVPQDGTFSFVAAGRSIDVRLAMLPQVNGPRLTLRLLDAATLDIRLDDMGFAPDTLELLRRATSQSQGTVVISGPTGSGKTTTLYALLREMDARSQNILTVEDPVEYRLEDIGQTAVRQRGGDQSLTFAKALRNILRQDPDVILVGEARDEETARVSMEAANTGHLVFTTVHTNSAAEAYTRFVEMGVPSYLVTESITLCVAQRLVRRVHTCATSRPPTEEERAAFAAANMPVPTEVPRAVGCDGCAGSGYRGRAAVVEVLSSDEEIRRLLRADAPKEELHAAAERGGFRPLRGDGLRQVADGTSTFEEVARVLPDVSAQAGGR